MKRISVALQTEKRPQLPPTRFGAGQAGVVMSMTQIAYTCSPPDPWLTLWIWTCEAVNLVVLRVEVFQKRHEA